jgi:Fe-S-cluster containining protein
MAEYKECESCPGYCCISNSELHTPLTNADIIRIAKYLKVPLERFVRDYVVLTLGRIIYNSAPGAIAHFKTLGPCPFLSSGLCAINEVKPQACSDAKPIHIDNRVSCAEWYKSRLGFKMTTEKKKDTIDIFPTCGEAIFGGE